MNKILVVDDQESRELLREVVVWAANGYSPHAVASRWAAREVLAP